VNIEYATPKRDILPAGGSVVKVIKAIEANMQIPEQIIK
jgi:hypothetical protein